MEATAQPEAARDGRIPVQVRHFRRSRLPLWRCFGDGIAAASSELRRETIYLASGTNLQPRRFGRKVQDRSCAAVSLISFRSIRFRNRTTLSSLQITAEEAKSKQLGFSAGYGTYEGFIGGVQYRELNLFGYGRPLTTSVEVSQRSYKGEIVYEDPYLFDTEFDLKTRVGALTFDYDGYSKFELGGSIGLSRKITKQYEVGAVFSVRHVEVTSASIPDRFPGRHILFHQHSWFYPDTRFARGPARESARFCRR